jgi:hypothetical protein
MKTKFIVASTIWLLGVTSMVIGAVTLADNDFTGKAWMRAYVWSGMMNKGQVMKKFTNTWDAEAFRTAVEKAITTNDYTAFTQAHIKYNITTPISKEQFTTMVNKRATQEKIKTALEAWDYTTWKTLNKDNPILIKIDTEAKFKQLQEMHGYQEKARTIAETLGLSWPKGEGMGRWMGMGLKNGEQWRRWMGNGMHNWNAWIGQ